MEKKRIFDTPEAIIIEFDESDVIVTSGYGDEEDPYQQWDH